MTVSVVPMDADLLAGAMRTNTAHPNSILNDYFFDLPSPLESHRLSEFINSGNDQVCPSFNHYSEGSRMADRPEPLPVRPILKNEIPIL